MKVRSDQKPDFFSIDEIPGRPGWCLCRFTENAKEYQNERGSIWEYDEYHLEQKGLKTSLERDILGNYELFLSTAKEKESPSEMEKLRADVDFILIMGGWE